MASTVKDAYTWHVTYGKDGPDLSEFDTEEGYGFAEALARGSITRLELIPYGPFDDIQHSILIPAGATPVFFRRRALVLSLSNESQQRGTVHCIGWRREDAGAYLFVFEDGDTLLTDDFQVI